MAERTIKHSIIGGLIGAILPVVAIAFGYGVLSEKVSEHEKKIAKIENIAVKVGVIEERTANMNEMLKSMWNKMFNDE